MSDLTKDALLVAGAITVAVFIWWLRLRVGGVL